MLLLVGVGRSPAAPPYIAGPGASRTALSVHERRPGPSGARARFIPAFAAAGIAQRYDLQPADFVSSVQRRQREAGQTPSSRCRRRARLNQAAPRPARTAGRRRRRPRARSPPARRRHGPPSLELRAPRAPPQVRGPRLRLLLAASAPGAAPSVSVRPRDDAPRAFWSSL